MKKRTISALLLCSMLALSACAGETVDTSSNDTTTASTETTVAEETTTARITPDLPDADFDGYTFKVLTRGTISSHWSSKDISAEEQNGEPINDAVYQRNSTVGEKYNFTVFDDDQYASDTWTGVNKIVLSGDNEVDMFAVNVAYFIKKGYLYNLYDVPNMDLDQPYYDQNIKESLTIADKLYAVTGDMLIMDNDATTCVQFNKKLADDYDIAKEFGEADLYAMVENDKWTLDAFYKTAKLVASDLDGDGEIDYVGDQWGLQSEAFNYLAMLNGAGEFLMESDSDGMPYITVNSDRAMSVLQKAHEIQSDKRVTLLDTDAQTQVSSDVWGNCIDKNFKEGRALYGIAGLNRVTLFRSMEIDFGILPVPKFDESQDRYYSTISANNANYISFPASMVEAERNGLIVEALSCESMYTLTPAYFEITLQGKSIRDEESQGMLEIILDTTVMDIGYYFGWGSLYTTIQNVPNLASSLAAAESKAMTEMQDTMDVILGK